MLIKIFKRPVSNKIACTKQRQEPHLKPKLQRKKIAKYKYKYISKFFYKKSTKYKLDNKFKSKFQMHIYLPHKQRHQRAKDTI